MSRIDQVATISPRRDHHVASSDAVDVGDDELWDAPVFRTGVAPPDQQQQEGDDDHATPVKQEDGGSPQAPPAPRPPSVHSERRTPSPTSEGLNLRSAFDNAAPQVPVLSARMQYTKVPLKRQVETAVQITATPPPADGSEPHKALLVLALDKSLSMSGTPMDTLKTFFAKFFANHAQMNTDLYMRVLLFGEHVEDKNIGPGFVRMLSAATVGAFTKIIADIKPDGKATNISNAVSQALGIAKDGLTELKGKGIDGVDVAHVICFTDGAANEGITDGAELADVVRKSGAPEFGVFTHYIGLGGAVRGKFMKHATAKGKLGVFTEAATPVHVPQAFEEVFCFLSCRNSFSIRVSGTDACGASSVRDFHLGMLAKERTHIVKITPQMCSTACTLTCATVQVLFNGLPVGAALPLLVTYEGVEYGPEDPVVRGAILAETLYERKDAISDTTGISMMEVSQAEHQLAEELKARPDYDEKEHGLAYRSLRAASQETAAAAKEYGDLGDDAAALWGARTASLRAHT